MEHRNIFEINNTEDLPESLRKELRICKSDQFTDQLLELFQKAKRPLSMDEIMVAYYRLYKEQKDRRQLVAKLYAMSKKHLVVSITGKKGYYKSNDAM